MTATARRRALIVAAYILAAAVMLAALYAWSASAARRHEAARQECLEAGGWPYPRLRGPVRECIFDTDSEEGQVESLRYHQRKGAGDGR